MNNQGGDRRNKRRREEEEDELANGEAFVTASHSKKKGNSGSNSDAKKKNDVLGRLDVGSKAGRGSESGWTLCPLCQEVSKKRFAMGRGIAAHLHAVHTPWKLGKAERKLRQRKLERQRRAEMMMKRKDKKRRIDEAEAAFAETSVGADGDAVATGTWEPTQQEIDAWDAKVKEILFKLEEEAHRTKVVDHDSDDKQHSESAMATASRKCSQPEKLVRKTSDLPVDRNGKPVEPYGKSLPPFLRAAADGDLDSLREMVSDAKSNDACDCRNNNKKDGVTVEAGEGGNGGLCELLNARDRHGSTAEHWAAGGGHLECLKYLVEVAAAAKKGCASSSSIPSGEAETKVRRRDGKTSLHYAARNGRVECLRYLLEEIDDGNAVEGSSRFDVDERSGDGTTPLHLACFGGHADAVKYLLDRGANPKVANDWGCTAAHWTGLTRRFEVANDDGREIYRLCNLLRDHGVSFAETQRHGHSVLHKAAQRKNRFVIEWMARTKQEGGPGLSKSECFQVSKPDDGGHRPSDIWLAAGGIEEFARWMREEMNW